MDEKIFIDVIEDLENMKELLDRCVHKLRTLTLAEVTPKADAISHIFPAAQNNISAEVDNQRKVIMAQIDQIRIQAMQTVAAVKNSSGLGQRNILHSDFVDSSGVAKAGLPIQEELRRQMEEKIKGIDKSVDEKDRT